MAVQVDLSIHFMHIACVYIAVFFHHSFKGQQLSWLPVIFLDSKVIPKQSLLFKERISSQAEQFLRNQAWGLNEGDVFFLGRSFCPFFILSHIFYKFKLLQHKTWTNTIYIYLYNSPSAQNREKYMYEPTRRLFLPSLPVAWSRALDKRESYLVIIRDNFSMRNKKKKISLNYHQILLLSRALLIPVFSLLLTPTPIMCKLLVILLTDSYRTSTYKLVQQSKFHILYTAIIL